MGLFSFFKDISANAKNSQLFGPPKNYLSNVTSKLNEGAIGYKILAENAGRLKVQADYNKFTLKVDFIYFADNIQVTIDLVCSNSEVKVFECPYDRKEIEKVIAAFLEYSNSVV